MARESTYALNAVRDIHVSTNDGEIESLARADIAVADRAMVERDAGPQVGTGALRYSRESRQCDAGSIERSGAAGGRAILVEIGEHAIAQELQDFATGTFDRRYNLIEV